MLENLWTWLKTANVSKKNNRVSLWDDDRVLKMVAGDDCTKSWMYLMPMNCTLKNG